MARRGPLIAVRWYLDVGGLMKPSPRFLLDQFIDLLRKENKIERQKWIAAHAREWYRRLPRHSHAAR